ncbi:MAG: hypothetical protein LBE96_10990 [Kalamiella piersonii]|nr:hypothetical protein [Pantoea piersonii]MBZ6408392.1 hypothetical protein [Pantoea piersonii]
MSHKSPKFASAGPGTATGPQLPVAGKPLPPPPIDIRRGEQHGITF